MSLCQTVNGNVEYEYVHKSQGLNGYNELGITPVIMELYGRDGKKLDVYCADMNTRVISGCEYNCKSINEYDGFDSNICKHLRNILKNAYPYISIEKMQQKSGIKYIKKKEAITAVQYAIWHYTNNVNLESKYSVVNELYDWLINLESSDENEDNTGDAYGRTGEVYIAFNNSVKTQMLIGMGEFTESETDTTKENESSKQEESTTEENTTREDTTEESTTGEESTEETITEENTTKKQEESSSINESVTNESTSEEIINTLPVNNINDKKNKVIRNNDDKNAKIKGVNNNQSCSKKYKSPKTGDSIVSIVVIMGVAISMAAVFVVMKVRRD